MIPRPRARAAVFLDRDGTVSELVTRDGQRVSPRRAEDFRIVPQARMAVERLRAAGFSIFIVTNQPDIARGRLAPAELERMNSILVSALKPDGVAVCPHDDAVGCRCRKPKAGMLLDLAARWSLDLTASVIVGDSWRDIEAGRRVGCRTVLLSSDPDTAALAAGPDSIVSSLEAAITQIEDWMTTMSPGRD